MNGAGREPDLEGSEEEAAPAVDPEARPPLRPRAIVASLAKARVEWVLTGSVVLVAYGAELVPGDLDVTPALDEPNLARLGEILRDLGARPAYVPDWAPGPDLDRCAAWSPDPATVERLDHLFVTPLGMLDVVPRLCGTYDELRGEATLMPLGGVPVAVCHPGEVLARLTGRTRDKDLRRAAAYATVRARLARGDVPPGLERLPPEPG